MDEILDIKITPHYDLSEISNKRDIVDIDCREDDIYILIKQKQRISTKSNYDINSSTNSYHIYLIKNNKDIVHICSINNTMDVHFLRRLKDNDDFLLVCARCRFYSCNNIEKNAFIVNSSGEIKKTLVLGDGIEDIKIENQIIWVSYFDEGVFGNFGWDNPNHRIGADGLVAFTMNGEKAYGYNSKCGNEHFISDCYAFNIDDNGEKWIYSYDEFILCKLNRNNQEKYYFCDNIGGSLLLVYSDYILMDGGYKNRDLLTIYKRNKDNFIKTIDIRLLCNTSNKKLEMIKRYYNKDILIVYENNIIYKTRLSDILEQKSLI